jgi:hypothetical protein
MPETLSRGKKMKIINWLRNNEQDICQIIGGFITGLWLGIATGVLIFG